MTEIEPNVENAAQSQSRKWNENEIEITRWSEKGQCYKSIRKFS